MLDRPAFCVDVRDDLFVVTEPLTRLYAIFSKHPELSRITLERSRLSKNHPMVEQARQSATDKARELGWIV